MDSDKDYIQELAHNTLGAVSGPSFSTGTLIPFNHRDLGSGLKSARTIHQKSLINILNHIHFISGDVFARLRHSLTGEDFLLRLLQADPCQGNLVKFHVPAMGMVSFENFELLDLIIDDGKSVVLMPMETVNRDDSSIMVRIPPKGFIIGQRNSRRFTCRNIDVELACAGCRLAGTLVDFSFEGLCIRLEPSGTNLKDLLRDAAPLTMNLRCGREQVLSGEARLLQVNESGEYPVIVVAPTNTPHVRYKKRKYRHPRIKLVPTPKITFMHPLSNKRVTYDLSDIGATGFSVDESSDEALLMPGIIIRDITILFAGGFQLTCSAQVVYSERKRGRSIHHGFLITDMDTVSYCRLFDIVSNAYDPRANMTSEIDMDTLWEFFFKSGFIYPKKYESLSPYKEEFKDTYRKLYQECQEIFSCLTYQRNGKIYGHNCAIKAYQRSWMIYHLAATSKGARQIGLNIMRHSHIFYDGLYRIPSIGMDYMVIYYRPNNKFPDYFFGGFCRHFKNPKACSMDTYAYFYHTLSGQQQTLPDGWSLSPCEAEDHQQLRKFYEQNSGGLMLDMFGFDLTYPEEPLEQVYDRLGLTRKSKAVALKYQGQLKAVLIVDQSNMGTNLSELLNNIKIIVMDEENMPWGVLETAVEQMGHVYAREKIPIMVYPLEYAQRAGVEFDKRYNLWIINSRFGDEYIDYMRQQLRFSTLKFLRFIIRNLIKR